MNDIHLQTLRAAIDRVVPADEFPSASEVGVDGFILRLLTGDLAGRKGEFLAGLDLLNTAAMNRNGSTFAQLTAAEQDEILRAFEFSTDGPSRSFFALLVEVTIEGYYADPANGGNRDAVSWKMIGYDPRVPGLYEGGGDDGL